MFRPSAVGDREGAVYYQISHNGAAVDLPSAHTLRNEEWDAGGRPAMHGADPADFRRLKATGALIKADLERLRDTARRLEAEDAGYDLTTFLSEYRSHCARCSLFNFMGELAAAMRANGRVRTSETYLAALSSFRRFRGGADVLIDTLTSELMEDCQAYLRSRGVTLNTVSFYMRILRAVYNRAADEGLTPRRMPFRHVYTGAERTVKRAVPLEALRRIRTLDLSASPSMAFARDMFVLSFSLRGMSLIDMAFLRRSDIRGGQLIYRRRKTGKRLAMEWTEWMQTIVDRYAVPHSAYLLPLLAKARPGEERRSYLNATYRINSSLKRIGAMVGLTMPLTLYCARHSWASVARDQGVPLTVISEGMGHDSELTTRIYLTQLDTSAVDRANRMVFRSI